MRRKAQAETVIPVLPVSKSSAAGTRISSSIPSKLSDDCWVKGCAGAQNAMNENNEMYRNDFMSIFLRMFDFFLSD